MTNTIRLARVKKELEDARAIRGSTIRRLKDAEAALLRHNEALKHTKSVVDSHKINVDHLYNQDSLALKRTQQLEGELKEVEARVEADRQADVLKSARYALAYGVGYADLLNLLNSYPPTKLQETAMQQWERKEREREQHAAFVKMWEAIKNDPCGIYTGPVGLAYTGTMTGRFTVNVPTIIDIPKKREGAAAYAVMGTENPHTGAGGVRKSSQGDNYPWVIQRREHGVFKAGVASTYTWEALHPGINHITVGIPTYDDALRVIQYAEHHNKLNGNNYGTLLGRSRDWKELGVALTGWKLK
jgi:hypothetical protein